MTAEPTERDHFPVDAAVGRYRRLCDEYVAHVRQGNALAAAALLVRIERARVELVTVAERFNATWGRM